MKKSTAIRRQLLLSLGLPEKEAVVYEKLLGYGEIQAARLEKATGYGKNTYVLLKKLAKRGLVHRYLKDGKSYYQVGSPEQLRVYLQEQEEQIKETGKLFREVLPELQKEYRARVNRPVVRHFQGKVGLKKVLEEAYKGDKKEIYGCVGWTKPSEILSDVMQRLSYLRVEREIKTYALNNNTEAGKKFVKRAKDPENFAEVFLADLEKYPLPAEIDVWGEVVAMMSWENEDFQAVLIENKEFARTLRSVFELLFFLLRNSKIATN